MHTQCSCKLLAQCRSCSPHAAAVVTHRTQGVRVLHAQRDSSDRARILIRREDSVIDAALDGPLVEHALSGVEL